MTTQTTGVDCFVSVSPTRSQTSPPRFSVGSQVRLAGDRHEEYAVLTVATFHEPPYVGWQTGHYCLIRKPEWPKQSVLLLPERDLEPAI